MDKFVNLYIKRYSYISIIKLIYFYISLYFGHTLSICESITYNKAIQLNKYDLSKNLYLLEKDVLLLIYNFFLFENKS